jgi:hypothetical protein
VQDHDAVIAASRVLAVIGVAGVAGQLITWAAVVHWIAEKYAIVWWHDLIFWDP